MFGILAKNDELSFLVYCNKCMRVSLSKEVLLEVLDDEEEVVEILDNEEELAVLSYIEMREHVLRAVLGQYGRFIFNAEMVIVS